MRKYVSFLVLFGFFAGCSKEPQILTQEVEFLAEDGVRLPGILFVPESRRKLPGVVLVPMEGRDSRSWSEFPCILANNGFVVLAIDLRIKGEAVESYDVEQHQLDIIGAANYLANMGRVDRERIAVVGASLGGLSALVAGSKSSLIKAVATISAPFSWRNIDFTEYLEQFAPRPIFVTAATDDTELPLNEAKKLYLSAKEPRYWFTIQSSRHGSDILSAEKGEELSIAIVDFLKRSLSPNNNHG